MGFYPVNETKEFSGHRDGTPCYEDALGQVKVNATNELPALNHLNIYHSCVKTAA